MDKVTRGNYNELMVIFLQDSKVSLRQVAKAIGCTEITLNRLIAKITVPSDEMLRQTGIMLELGYKSYAKLAEYERKNIMESIGIFGGVALGFGMMTGFITDLTYGGVSSESLISGLEELGALFGSDILIGMGIAVSVIALTGITGYGIAKALKTGITNAKSNKNRIDERWEMAVSISEVTA